MRDRGHVADGLDNDSRGLKRADGGFAAGARPFHPNLQALASHGPHRLSHLARGLLRRERRSFARALETKAARARPGHDIAFHVGDGHVRVVEGRLNMGDPTQERAFFLLLEGLALALLVLFFLLLLGQDVTTSSSSFSHLATLRPFARPGIGARALPPRRETAAMTKAAIGPDIHQSLDVHRDFLAQITLDSSFVVDRPADLTDLLLGQLLDASRGLDPRLGENPRRPDVADTINMG